MHMYCIKNYQLNTSLFTKYSSHQSSYGPEDERWEKHAFEGERKGGLLTAHWIIRLMNIFQVLLQTSCK